MPSTTQLLLRALLLVRRGIMLPQIAPIADSATPPESEIHSCGEATSQT